MRITNNFNVSLALAVWLAHDDYDYVEGVENYISVTMLMKPIRQIILPSRIPAAARTMDVSDLIASSMGHALHDSVEKAWKTGYRRALKLLGYPDEVIERVRINPTPEEVRASNDIIPIYLEQRAMRDIDGYTIGGKLDFSGEGVVQDTKSMSVWGWIKGNRDDEHRLQMSLYRWIDAAQPVRRITEDFGQVNYIFTDWSKMDARYKKDYPQSRVQQKKITLMSLDETENWVRQKLSFLQAYANKPEAEIPECTDEELWRSEPQFKYFSDPEKAKTGGRSTRNFDTLAEANAFMAEKGGKGIVKTVPGEVKRCGYCNAFDACTQKDKYQ